MDTGADISLCKENILDIYDTIDESTFCTLTGISNESTKSLGTVNMQLGIFDKTFFHNIHIAEKHFPIMTDGIIGRDIFNKLLAKIDYETFTLTFVIENEEFTIPIKTKIFKDFIITIPKRSETIHQININLKEDSLILNKEIADGIFLSNCIVPKEGLAHVKILNTTDNDVNFKNLEFDVEPFSNYHCITHNKVQNKLYNKDRFKKVLKTINIDSIDDRVRNSLYDIIEEYNDIFHLEGDNLSANNFYRQHLNLTDKTPVYIKNYRLQQTQIEEIDQQVHKLLDDDIIEHSTSPYNSPLLVVPKKSDGDEKKWRLVVDFRQLNKTSKN